MVKPEKLDNKKMSRVILSAASWFLMVDIQKLAQAWQPY